MISKAEYQGWTAHRMTNGLVELDVVPEIGGRVIQFRRGGKEFFWVNPDLAGQRPPPGGLGPDGGWLNYGGDKLWPAPQGWDGDDQWPGPPDAVLDGQPYAFERLPERPGEAAIRLTSRKDPRSGIRFSRVIRIFEGTTRVGIEATMENVDTRPRRWGIWPHTQLDAGLDGGTKPNRLLKAWCPVNRKSAYPEGFRVMFGRQDHPSFEVDRERGLVGVTYRYEVGKIGVDSHGGWVATVDGTSGDVFVQRFEPFPGREYPDGASIEFWLNGPGTIHAYNRDIEMPDDAKENPFVFESELLSPFAELGPGESYSYRYEWYATNVGGDHKVLDCTPAGVVVEPLAAPATDEAAKRRGPQATRCRLTGRFGVFAPGTVGLRFLDARLVEVGTVDTQDDATPARPVVMDREVKVPPGAGWVEALLKGSDGKVNGVLGRAQIKRSS